MQKAESRSSSSIATTPASPAELGHLHYLLDLSAAAVVIRDADGNVEGFNHIAEELSGYTFEEVRGKTLWSILVPAEQAARAKMAFQKILDGMPRHNEEIVWIRKDASHRVLTWSSIGLRDPGDSSVRVISTGMDITALKSTEDALRASEERFRAHADTLRRWNVELKRINEDLNEFAYSAAHDLQEPLRMVATYTQLLQQKYAGKLDGNADQFLNILLQGATRMDLLIKSLLSYAQTLGLPEGEIVPLDAGMVLEKALANLRASIEENGAVITHDGLPLLAVTETHLLQLFQNLIGNAIKYRSVDPPRIHIRAERDGDAWCIWIQDNGIGIDPKYAELIFGFFKRLHSSSDYSGAGLGLATCRKIVERYGGRIAVHSAEGQGAAFCFTLPAAGRKNVRSATRRQDSTNAVRPGT